jgi:pantetheine-phosphate adenylyltransferase
MRHSAIYPGTFDPLTLGHYDLMERASGIFDRVIVAVAENSRKQTLFTVDDRVDMARRATQKLSNVMVKSFSGLLIDFAQEQKIHVLVRGIRAFSDFEYEFQMALTNRKLAPGIETLFLMPKEAYSYISSSTVREVAERGGDLHGFVPASLVATIRRKCLGRL